MLKTYNQNLFDMREKKDAEAEKEKEVAEDYEQTKEELAKLRSREENYREEIATSQALNQFFMMANFLQEHQNCLPKVLKGYLETDGITNEHINQIEFVSAILKKILYEGSLGVRYTYIN